MVKVVVTPVTTSVTPIRPVPSPVVWRWLNIILYILVAILSISFLIVGRRCYYDSDKTWVNDAQQCINVYISGIIMMFIVCIVIAFDAFFCLIRYLDA